MEEGSDVVVEKVSTKKKQQKKEKKARPVRARPSDFGKRYLEEEDDVFQHNAWDDVEFPPEQEEIVRQTIEKQKSAAVDEEKAKDLVTNPESRWNDFYEQHECKFFMDRKWLDKEAPELFEGGTQVRVGFAWVERSRIILGPETLRVRCWLWGWKHNISSS